MSTDSYSRPERYDWRMGDVVASGKGRVVLLGLSRYMIQYAQISGSVDSDDGWMIEPSRKINAGLFDHDYHREMTRAEFYDLVIAQMPTDFALWPELPKKGSVYFLRNDGAEIDDAAYQDLINGTDFDSNAVLGRHGDILLVADAGTVVAGDHLTWTTQRPVEEAPWECWHVLDFMRHHYRRSFVDDEVKAAVTGWKPRYPIDEASDAGKEEQRKLREYLANHQ